MSGMAAVPADPLGSVPTVVRSLRGRVEQSVTALRTVTARLKDADTGIGRLAAAAGQAAGSVRRSRQDADASARSLTRTGRTAASAASGVRAFRTGAKGAGSRLGPLLTGLGGVLSLIVGLIDVAGPLGTLMSAFGTAMTIGSGVLLVVNALTRANPIGFVTGLLLPVAGWLLDIAMNSETGQRLMDQLAKLVLRYVESYLTILTPVLRAIAGAVNTYVTGYLTVITGVLTALGTLIGTGFAVLKALTTGDTRALSGRVSAIWRGFRTAVQPVLGWITRDLPRIFGRVKEATSRTLSAMGQFVTTGAQTVAGVVRGPVQGLVAFANWVVDGLNKLSFNLLGKKFGVHLSKIPMLAEGGVAVPGATRHSGRVLPLTALEHRRAPALGGRTAAARPPHRVERFHESHGTGARTVAEDLLFLARAHAPGAHGRAPSPA
ncbi:tape-measure protein [Streptomyces sp. NPDC088785]|uniref:tape-measure protein n=1 Tax=Streptomyces sp. NPDC088785 TaxID=3365897 RepID=UPI00380BE46B